MESKCQIIAVAVGSVLAAITVFTVLIFIYRISGSQEKQKDDVDVEKLGTTTWCSSRNTQTDHPDLTFDGLNYERCAKLYNGILEHAWKESGRDTDVLDRRSWWEYHGDEAESIRHRLHPSVIEFLQRVQVGTTDADWNWFYGLPCISTPAGLFEPGDMERPSNWRIDQDSDDNFETVVGSEEEEDEDQYNRFLLLVPWGLSASHRNGLIFDQQDFSAVMEPDILDEFVTRNGRQSWHYLETIFEAFVDAIELGKVQVRKPNLPSEDIDQFYTEHKPWIWYPYTEKVVDRTIAAYEDLIAAIEERQQAKGLKLKQSGRLADVFKTTEQLADNKSLSAIGIDGFARDFLTRARKPDFKYIAPGISIQSPQQLTQQPYWHVEQRDDELQPILLFRGDRDVEGLGGTLEWYESLEQYPSGLYLSSCSRLSDTSFEDATKFVLPYGIGANGFAKQADDALFGEATDSDCDPKPQDKHDALFSLGWNPFFEMHDTQLYRVLEKWAELVREGHWDVDENGVTGGIDKFRDADTEEHWEKYQLIQEW